MTYNSTTPEDMALRLPIASQAIALANRFSQQQPTPEKRAQVSLNTLAVCAINDYLQMMGFETNLTAGDSWNPIARMCADVADLEVTNIGKLECRPVNPGDLEYSIPPEVWLDRVGYMFVQIDPAAREATILGFIPQARASVRLSQLQSIEDFIDHLHELTIAPPVVQLYRWLADLNSAIETGWQTVESLFTTPELAFRSANSSQIPNSIQRGKVIDLGIQLQGHSIALIVELSPVADTERTQVRLRVTSTTQSYLLPNIQLIVTDESNQSFLEAQSRTTDNIIQLQFTGNPGEKFGAIVRLGEAEVSEQFVI
jgi:Protein of unknown function (DUF1822)